MDTWTDIVVFFAGFFVLDQVCLWMERRSWIEWRGAAQQRGDQ
jgi:hypothetical protein